MPEEYYTFAELAGYKHDLDMLTINRRGPSEMFLNARGVDLDWNFVGRPFYLGTKYIYNQPINALRAYTYGLGVGIPIIPKSIINTIIPYGW